MNAFLCPEFEKHLVNYSLTFKSVHIGIQADQD